ncbi:hypothetical protein J6590_105320 [Homalodisca vitripennis]|nr:hypothetical protein J6590_105320 [Homalodisca vitripennis]
MTLSPEWTVAKVQSEVSPSEVNTKPPAAGGFDMSGTANTPNKKRIGGLFTGIVDRFANRGG